MDAQAVFGALKAAWNSLPQSARDQIAKFAATEAKKAASVALPFLWNLVLHHVAEQIANGNPDFIGIDLDKLYASPPFAMDGDGVAQPPPPDEPPAP